MTVTTRTVLGAKLRAGGEPPSLPSRHGSALTGRQCGPRFTCTQNPHSHRMEHSAPLARDAPSPGPLRTSVPDLVRCVVLEEQSDTPWKQGRPGARGGLLGGL